MSDVTALVDWLREQVAEDERTARIGAHPIDPGSSDRLDLIRTRESSWHLPVCVVADDGVSITVPCDCGVPSRVLAEVAAKRTILDAYGAACRRAETAAADPGAASDWIEAAEAYADGLEAAVWSLAQPYASRPGFRPEWAVVPPG